MKKIKNKNVIDIRQTIQDHRWLFKIRLDDKFDFEDTSDENVGKMSKYLETKILSIANSNHAAITESIKEELTETARSFNFIHFLSDKSYEEREEYEMGEAELSGEFNFYLNELYDIGDVNRLIFIRTF